MTGESTTHVPETDATREATASDVVAHSTRVLAEKSRSFRWASYFLARPRRRDAAVLYAVCRLIDDIADETDDDGRARRALDRLRDELAGRRRPGPLVEAFVEMSQRRDVRPAYLRELICGVESDLGGVRIETDEELLRYCYRVAGTVGLLMCGVLGVDDPRGPAHAIDLGIAMQLTNICRDVVEDARRNRVYLPARRLEEIGANPERIVDGDFATEVVGSVVDDLLRLADDYYGSADDGMHYIPTRARLAIIVASRVYRAHGTRVRRRGVEATADCDEVPLANRVYRVCVATGKWAAMSGPWQDGDVVHRKRLHEPLRGLPGVSVD